MENVEFQKLLEKYQKQECSHEELLRLWYWLSDEKNENKVKAFLLAGLQQFPMYHKGGELVEFSRIYASIESKIRSSMPFSKSPSIPENDNRFSISGYLRLAAMIVVIFTLGASLSYWYFQKNSSGEVSFCEIKAPLGAKSEVTLPDGSRVWLNAGSRIRYQSLFNKADRNIYLEGEAYFKVFKNKKIPFIVRTADLKIVAVGTEFNVKSYNNEGIIETTLVEGKVTILREGKANGISSKVYLEPNHKAVYVRNQNNISIESIKKIFEGGSDIRKPEKGMVYITPKINPLPIISWKDNKLIIQGEEMGILAVKLERKYNVSILFATEKLKHFRFSGTLEDETLTQVLDVIKLSAPIEYELEGKEVKIVENLLMMKQFEQHMKQK